VNSSGRSLGEIRLGSIGLGGSPAIVFFYHGEREVVRLMPQIEGWIPEEPYPAMVVPEQFWTLHLKEAWKVAGDRRSPSTWNGASESVAGICGVVKMKRYVEPPCYYEGFPNFYVKREHAPYVRYTLIAMFMERITQALYKCDLGDFIEAERIIRGLESQLETVSKDFAYPEYKIDWAIALDTGVYEQRAQAGYVSLGELALGGYTEVKYTAELGYTKLGSFPLGTYVVRRYFVEVEVMAN